MAIQFTPHEQALLDYHLPYLPMEDIPQLRRNFELETEWGGREGALQRALDTSFAASLTRDMYRITEAGVYPEKGWQKSGEFFEQHGVLGGIGQIALSTVTEPFAEAGRMLGGQQFGGEGLGRSPLNTAANLAAFIPIGRVGALATGGGLRTAGGAALRGGTSQTARALVAAQAGELLQRGAMSRPARIASAGSEFLDVAAGAEMYPIEIGANVGMHLGTNAIAGVTDVATSIAAPIEIQPDPYRMAQLWNEFGMEQGEPSVPPPPPHIAPHMTPQQVEAYYEAARQDLSRPPTPSPFEPRRYNIGGQVQDFVPLDDQPIATEPGIGQPRQKQVIITDVQHTVVPDLRRQQLEYGSQQFPGEAEHVMGMEDARGDPKGVYEKILTEGKLLSTGAQQGRPFDPNMEMDYVYLSLGPGYRPFLRDVLPQTHYGFILDAEKIIQSVPDVQINIEGAHDLQQTRKEAIAFLRGNHPYADDRVALEIRVPRELDLNPYLIGVIEDGRVYVKPGIRNLADLQGRQLEFELAGQQPPMTDIKANDISYAAMEELIQQHRAELIAGGWTDNMADNSIRLNTMDWRRLHRWFDWEAKQRGLTREQLIDELNAVTGATRWTKSVDRILKDTTDVTFRRRVSGLFSNILSKKPVNLMGKKLASATDAALLAQPYRDPMIEKSILVYLRDNQVVGHEAWTLNRANYTMGPPSYMVNQHMESLGADSFVMLHNHPSGRALLSQGDVDSARWWSRQFGNRFKGSVVIDSGRYAKIWYDQSGTESIDMDLELPRRSLFGRRPGIDWDNREMQNPQGQTIHPNDPLYQGTTPDAVQQFAQAAPWGQSVPSMIRQGFDETSEVPMSDALDQQIQFARYMSRESSSPMSGQPADHYLNNMEAYANEFAQWSAEQAVVALGEHRKTPLNWTTLVFTDLNRPGNIVAMVDYENLHTRSPDNIASFIENEIARWGGSTAHVMIGPGDWYTNIDEVREKFSGLDAVAEDSFVYVEMPKGRYKRGIASVWLEEKPLYPVDYRQRGEPLYLRGEVRTPTLQQIEAVAPEGIDLREADQPGPPPPDPDDAGGFYVSGQPLMQDTLIGAADYELRRRQGIIGKLGAMLPRTKETFRYMGDEIRSGYRQLETMGELGPKLLAVANSRRDYVRRNMAKHHTLMNPILKARADLIRSLHQSDPSNGRDYYKSIVDEALYEYTEENVETSATFAKYNLTASRAANELAHNFKEGVRQINLDQVVEMMELKREAEAMGEEVNLWDSQNNRLPWRPFMPTWGWSNTHQQWVKNGRPYDLEEGIRVSDNLWMPHHYTKDHWNKVYQQTEAFLQMLQVQSNEPLPTALFDYDPTTQEWTNKRGQSFTDRARAIEVEREYHLSRNQVAQNYRDAMDAMADGRLGRQGHVERARETDDTNYLRDVDLYMQINDTFWERAGDIKFYGQYDPIFEGNPRLKAYLEEVRNVTKDRREEALRLLVNPLVQENALSGNKLYPGIENLEMDNPQPTMRNWDNIDVNALIAESRDPNNNIEPIDDASLAILVDIGLLNFDQNGGYTFTNETMKGKILGEYLSTVKDREDAVYSIVSGLSKWDRTPQEMSSTFWRRLSNVTTAMTLGIRASFQNLFEIPLLTSLTGSKAFLQATAMLAKDPDLLEVGPILGATMRQTLDYLKDGAVQERWLTISGFSFTDQFSRSFGALAGWKAAENAVRAYVENPTRNTRERVVQLQMDPTLLDEFRDLGTQIDMEGLFAEALQRTRDSLIMTAGVARQGAAPASNPFVDLIGDQLGKSASWISNTVFKEYDALSLPKFLRSQHPIIRVFMKYKSWQGQQHAFIMRQLRYARSEVMQGNWTPAWHLAQSMAILGGGSMMFLYVMGFVTGRHEEKHLLRRYAEGIANSGSLGTFSMLLDVAMLADGNPYRGVQIMNSILSNPTAGIAAEFVGRGVTGDIGGAAWAIGRQIPFIREAEQLTRGHRETEEDAATPQRRSLSNLATRRGS